MDRSILVSEKTHQQIQKLAQLKNVSVDALLEEFTQHALIEFDAQQRFNARKKVGNTKDGLAILDQIDKYFDR